MIWKEFGASAAEEITGMDGETQRVKRRRGQLTPIVGGKARLNAVLLGEMMLINDLAPYFIVDTLTITARALASSWIAFHAAVENGAGIEMAAKLTGRPKQKPPTHMLMHHGDTHWRQTVFTDDPEGTLAADRNPVALIVNLRALGQRLAKRAGKLFEGGND